MNDMDRHIQQTVDRLHCIKNHLSNPGGFQNAARELLEWCSDMRAFQKQFEDSLIGCLTIVSQVSTQPGFDLDLGYRLLAVCAAHRDKLSSKSAAMLSVWCEELGRLLLLRHQKNRGPDAKSPGMHPQIQKAMPPVPPGDPNGPWLGGNQGQPGQALSVVTTVWGTTQSTQSGPFVHNPPGFTNTTMSTTNYTQPPQGFQANPQMQKAPYSNGPQNIPFRRDSGGGYQRPSGYPPTPNTPGSNTPNGSEYHGGQAGNAALSAALVAAAATATATATATASMVMQQEQSQQQINMQMNMNGHGPYPPNMQQLQGQPGYSQYPGMHSTRPPGSMVQGPGPGGPGPMMNKYPRRPAPYHNPSQIMSQKRPGQPFPNGAQYGPQPYGGQQQFSSKSQYPPTQQPLPSPTYGPQPGMRPNAPPYANSPNPYMGSGQFPPGRQMPPQGQPYNQYNNPTQQQNMQPSNMNYHPHSPLPGNPTPPITPGAVQPPYPGQMGIKKDMDELRLTFPVRDGVVLPPFRLEHNLAVSNHVFHLRESVFQTLMWRSDLELQLKCFHHEDRQMNTNWPASVTVSVNANPLNIERGENKTSHKPLYLKNVCQPGRNTIQITVTACCCSHLFVLQLVHRPSVRSVLQGLLRKRLLPAEHCITKIKRNFTSVATGGSLNGEDGVEQTAIKVSLKCPITFRRISLPARGHECKHIQCFDLESYLQLNCERGSWRCPVCNKTALLEGLEIDQYIWGILTNLSNTEFEEVTIDPMAAWKPVQHKTIKEEDSGGDACANNTRWMKAMSPSSMQMPTMQSWDSGRQASPFPMRPSSQGPVYPGVPGGEGMPPGPPGNFQHQGGPTDYPTGPLTHMPGHPSGPDSICGMNANSMNSSDMNLHSLDTKPPLMPPHNSGQYPTVSSVGGDQLRHSDTPATPSSQSQTLNHNSGGNHPLSHPPSQQNSSQQSSKAPPTSSSDNCQIGELNFDPTPIIDGDGQSASIDLQLDNLGDPIELLSYLGPPENSDSPGTNGNNGNQANGSASSNNATDDLLALFD